MVQQLERKVMSDKKESPSKHKDEDSKRNSTDSKFQAGELESVKRELALMKEIVSSFGIEQDRRMEKEFEKRDRENALLASELRSVLVQLTEVRETQDRLDSVEKASNLPSKEALTHWTTQEVSTWLQQFNLPDEFTQAINQEDIDGVALLQLTPEDLKELGLTQMGPRKRLEATLAKINRGDKDVQVEQIQDALRQLQLNLGVTAKAKIESSQAIVPEGTKLRTSPTAIQNTVNNQRKLNRLKSDKNPDSFFSFNLNPFGSTGGGQDAGAAFSEEDLDFEYSLPPIISEEQLCQRDRVAFEILTTEETYVNGLKVVLKEFPNPLISAVPKNIKAQEEMRKIFGFVRDLYFLHMKMFLSIVERIQNWRENGELIGDIFSTYSAQMEPMYSNYASVYQQFVEMLNTLSQDNSQFKRAITTCNNKAYEQRELRLPDLLITPIQRLPRYSLLLGDLMKNTSSDHVDRPNLEEASKTIAEVTGKLNEFLRKSETDSEMVKLFDRGTRFQNLRTVPSPQNVNSRTFVTHLAIEKIQSSTNIAIRKKWMDLLLFNDIIVASPLLSDKGGDSKDAWFPLALTWFQHPLLEMEKALGIEVTPSDAIIRGPLGVWWLVSFSQRGEIFRFQNELLSRFALKPEELEDGIREGKYTAKGFGTYTGTWKDGWMHGKGTLTTPEGVVFEGLWHSKWLCGYGTLRSKNNSNVTKTGWKVIEGHVKVDDSNLWTEEKLTKSDWQKLSTGSITASYQPGGLITKDVNKVPSEVNKEGEEAASPRPLEESLYRLVEGTVRQVRERKTIREIVYVE
eukprot:TRINITY_DN7039_c1_g3_i2.p1 TRINITY_DN7039_c1_g3~~TRINITY_DN7039_c1_g3_i2.p1  ORF type:complete len:913 (+),score=236.71 TRINITY_DN7039_c1_g3_i2:346-2739(+)